MNCQPTVATVKTEFSCRPPLDAVPQEKECEMFHNVSSEEDGVLHERSTEKGNGAKLDAVHYRPLVRPKHPLTAYNFFFREERARLLGIEGNGDVPKVKRLKRDRSHKKTHGKIGFRDLGKMVGAKWKALGSEQRAVYKAMADKETKRYGEEMKVYKKALLVQQCCIPPPKVSDIMPRKVSEGYQSPAGLCPRPFGAAVSKSSQVSQHFHKDTLQVAMNIMEEVSKSQNTGGTEKDEQLKKVLFDANMRLINTLGHSSDTGAKVKAKEQGSIVSYSPHTIFSSLIVSPQKMERKISSTGGDQVASLLGPTKILQKGGTEEEPHLKKLLFDRNMRLLNSLDRSARESGEKVTVEQQRATIPTASRATAVRPKAAARTVTLSRKEEKTKTPSTGGDDVQCSSMCFGCVWSDSLSCSACVAKSSIACRPHDVYLEPLDPATSNVFDGEENGDEVLFISLRGGAGRTA